WDNQTSTAVCWDKVPVGVSNWSASTRVAWTGNNVAGTIRITVTTTTHAYTWDANDMFKRYMLWRDGIAIWTGPLYIGQLGVWHDLRIDFVSGAIHLYLDELPMQTVSVQDIGTNLTGIVLQSQSGTNNSFAYVKADAVDPNAPDFTLIAGPTSQNITINAIPGSLILQQGPLGQWTTHNITITIRGTTGFTGTIALSVSVSAIGPSPNGAITPSELLITGNKTYTATLYFPQGG